ncbi:MAG: cation diffusion facilitator family transporter [Elusimicrobiota bacterium]
MEYFIKGRKEIVIGSIVNILLSIMKITAGFSLKSYALIADGFHSFADLVTDVIAYLGIKLSVKPADENHPYGHKKIEDMAAILMGLSLISVALVIMYRAFIDIYRHNYHQASVWVIVFAGLSVVGKEIIFYRSKKVALEIGSDALLANAWHHRSDSFTSLAVMIGIGAALIYEPLHILDAVIACVIGVFIARVGILSFWKPIHRLVDTAAPEEIIQKICGLVMSCAGVKGYHKCRTRYVGRFIVVEVHVQVDGKITVFEGHEIAARIKHCVLENMSEVQDVIVHVEPEK